MSSSRTDDPAVALAGLRVVEAALHGDGEALQHALLECRDRALPVMLSIAATAAELIRSAPQGEEWLRHLMLGLEVETIGESPDK